VTLAAPTGVSVVPEPVPAVGDSRIRELLERYAALSGGSLEQVGFGCYEFVVPAQDRPFFGEKERIRVAFSVEAAEHEPEAQLAILGSAFVDQLVNAVRARGSRLVAGLVAPSTNEVVERPSFPIPVERGTASESGSRIARHRIGRLTARVVMRAGTFLEEQLVESSLFDLVTGSPLGPDVAEACEARLRDVAGVDSSPSTSEPLEPTAKIGSLLKKMLGDLETRLKPNLDALQQKAQRELAHETGRIDRYYASLLTDMGGRGSEVPTKDARDAVEAEKLRRIREEQDRHTVRATVHPVQLTEWEVGVQRAEWIVKATDGHEGSLTAQRTLAGNMVWTIACPSCGASNPSSVAVCIQDHVGCDRCVRVCSVCESSFCVDHGIAACRVDGAPCCAQHTRTCPSCLEPHCSQHEGECADGGHPACTTCLAGCAHCGRVVCVRHSETTRPDAPRGLRRLCMNCARKCEGGSNEIVGPDEVARCVSCGRDVCEHHQARCAVDGQVHCSTHLRRTDRSRRLVCVRDRASCAHEPNAVFAIDEVQPCATCGAMGCTAHLDPCVEDGAKHCVTHLHPLADRPGTRACESHRSVCHVDSRVYSLTGTSPCPVCSRLACAAHMRVCGNCFRTVCTAEFRVSDPRRCSTCARLELVSDPPDSVIAAAVALRGADGKTAKSWKVSRDASHQVVELDFGWTRRLVFTVRHGDSTASTAVSHSALGARVLVQKGKIRWDIFFK
jgi:hypothetical protein